MEIAAFKENPYGSFQEVTNMTDLKFKNFYVKKVDRPMSSYPPI